MSLLRDATYGLYGAWRLLRFDGKGADYFENTGAAGWRSFRALWLFIPLYALFIALFLQRQGTGGTPVSTLVLLQLSTQMVTLFGYLLAVHHILDLMKLGDRYPAYVAAYNWGSVVQVVILVIGTGLAFTPGLGEGGSGLVQELVGVLLLVYSAVIARYVLDVGWIGAIGLVALDMFITNMVGLISAAILRA